MEGMFSPPPFLIRFYDPIHNHERKRKMETKALDKTENNKLDNIINLSIYFSCISLEKVHKVVLVK